MPTEELPTDSPPSSQSCGNCGTTKTPLWRRGPSGMLICNACGLYYRANNCHRPVNLKRPPHVVTVSSEDHKGTCKGDGRCNGTGGSAGCKGCPAFNNRIVIPSAIKREASGGSPLSSTSDGESVGPSDISKDSKNNNITMGSVIGEETIGNVAIACTNCGTTVTPLWRRDENGDTICNACGLYYKLHGRYRPTKMKRGVIKRRKRNPQAEGSRSPGASSPELSPEGKPPLQAHKDQYNDSEQVKLPPIRMLPLKGRHEPAVDFTAMFARKSSSTPQRPLVLPPPTPSPSQQQKHESIQPPPHLQQPQQQPQSQGIMHTTPPLMADQHGVQKLLSPPYTLSTLPHDLPRPSPSTQFSRSYQMLPPFQHTLPHIVNETESRPPVMVANMPVPRSVGSPSSADASEGATQSSGFHGNISVNSLLNTSEQPDEK